MRLRELRTSAGWGILIFAVSAVPYLLAYALAPRGSTFNGFFFIIDDAATYISKMRQGADGAWGWADPYNTQPVAQPVLLFTFYIVWGKVAALLHISMFAGYQLARLSGAVALVFGVRMLVRSTLPPGRCRAVAAVLACVGSGAGFLLAILSSATHQPAILGQDVGALDLHLPELSGFYSVLAIPHFSWAAALMAISVAQLMAVARVPRPSAAMEPSAWSTVAMLALCLIHPQMIFLLAPLAAVYLLLVRARPVSWGLVAIPFLVCVPLLVYDLRILTGDPVIVEWSKQWKHQAPGFLSLIFGLGLPLALAVVAVASGAGRRTPELSLLVAWLVLVGLMLYLPNPVNIQRRLIDGLYIPVGILAAVGLEVVIERRARRRGSFRQPGPIVTLAVGVSVLTPMVLWLLATGWAVGHEPNLFLPASEVAAIDWLSQSRGTADPAPGVLSDALSGLYIPERSGDRVYAGHYSETLSYLDRARLARAEIQLGDGTGTVTSGSTTLPVDEFMQEQGIEYLFLGPVEVRAGVGPVPAALSLVYDRDGVRIYRLGR
ncbi:MAG TPA: hypothetical protein VIN56_07230 [Candidatus Dormibacteraeota bacterium]